MSELGYDVNFTTPIILMVLMLLKLSDDIIAFGLQDGSNEINGYENQYYDAINDPLLPMFSGNPDIENPNRWQPLTLQVFIDQAGNMYPINTPFLNPEWGQSVHLL